MVAKLITPAEVSSDISFVGNHWHEDVHDFNVKFQECIGYYEGKLGLFADFGVDEDITGAHYVVGQFYPLITNIKRIYPSHKSDSLFISLTKFSPSRVKVKMEYSKQFIEDCFVIPSKGFINHDFYVVFVERHHKLHGSGRYRRGFRRDHVHAKSFCSRELERIFSSSNEIIEGLDTDINNLLPDLYNPYYFTPDEAIEKILSYERIASAINSSLAVKYNSNYNAIVLYKNALPIGDYDVKDKSFLLRTDLFIDDLQMLNIKYKFPKN